MKLWENWKCTCVLLVISVVVVGIIFGIEKQQQKSNNETLNRPKREVSDKIDECLKYYGGIELDYVKGSTTSFTFDLCSVIDCNGQDISWRGYDVYLCGLGWPGHQAWCPSWNHVWQSTQPGVKGSTKTKTADGRLNVPGHFSIQRDFSESSNPITVSITGLTYQPYNKKPRGVPGQCWKPDTPDFYLLLGVDVSGKDPKGLIKINLIEKPKQGDTTSKNISVKTQTDKYVGIDYTKLTPEDIIEKATGYGETNLWLQWLINTAKEQRLEDCVACAGARPRLHIEPAPLHPNDTWGYECMLSLTRTADSTKCTTLAAIFPPIANESRIGPFTPRRDNYTCFNFTPVTPTVNYGQIDKDWCSIVIPDSGILIGSWARAGLYYYCGDRRLFTRIPPNTKGLCAMVRLGAPLTLIGERLVANQSATAASLSRRRRRHVIRSSPSSIDLSLNSPTYFDAIGVPRGVPDEYKLADQVAAGFENIPIIAAIFPVTPNKNVDRINYVHYNVMRLANLTRDAVEGLSEQLAPTSLMAIQNRMALDMLLAEKGGVCSMFGELCCTFIPNNTAPDGSVNKALEGLRVLAVEMKEHSGINNPVTQWLDKALGKWRALIMSIVVSIAVFVGILVTCGCCCVPCIRSLCNRLIVTAIEKRDAPPAYNMPLLTENHCSDGSDDEESNV